MIRPPRPGPDLPAASAGGPAARSRLARRFAPSPHGLYYGWILVAALALTEATSWGVLYYAFTVFLNPMHQSLGWSRASLSGAFSLALLLSGLVGIPLGRWLDRHGARLLMTAGSCAAVALLLAWSAVHTLTAFYLIWAGIGVTMGAVLYEPAFFVVAAWFRRRRGAALSLLTFIAGFASVIYVPLTGWLVATQGWRSALVTLAVLMAVVTIPLHALVLRRRPEDLGLAPDGLLASPPEAAAPAHPEPGATVRVAVADRAFWLLTSAFCLSTLCVGVIFVYLVPYLTDNGYPPGVAAAVVGFIGILALPGRLILTTLGERVPRGLVAGGIFGVQALAFLVLLLVPGFAGVVAFVVLFGAGFGAITPARAALVAEYYGPTHFGSINGIVAFILNLARAVAPVSAGVGYALTGGYSAILWALVALSAVATLQIILADRRAVRSGFAPRRAAPPADSPPGRYGIASHRGHVTNDRAR